MCDVCYLACSYLLLCLSGQVLSSVIRVIFKFFFIFQKSFPQLWKTLNTRIFCVQKFLHLRVSEHKNRKFVDKITLCGFIFVFCG